MHTVASLTAALEHDDKVKLAGIDADGILRGKLVSKKKFLSVASSGFGFCSVVFGWDMHDSTYTRELGVSNKENGYRDVLALIDLQSFRRVPWEPIHSVLELSTPNSTERTEKQAVTGVPFFLVSFHDPDTKEPIAPCPRGLLKRVCEVAEKKGWKAMAGVEYEFYVFKETPSSLLEKEGSGLTHVTPGMFGYSLSRPAINQDFYYGLWDACSKFSIPIEGWHTESGPGVYEAALEYAEATVIADRAALFKHAAKAIGGINGLMPCFMAKPVAGLPGNSGHLHVSLVSETGNLFARESTDPNPPYAGLEDISDLGRHFLAGVIEGLRSITCILAPTINSYKRLVENFWAPTTVSWGLEHRAAAIRIIADPSSPKATRFEIRTPGADVNAAYALAAVLACGLRGIEEKLQIQLAPLGKGEDGAKAERLPKTLREAVNAAMEEGSVVKKVLGEAFVDHWVGTREHECRLWEEAVTDWEVRRYTETV